MPIIEQAFLDLTRALDVDAFWAENAQCQAFSPAKPRCAAAFSPDDHWLFEFFQVPSTVRYYHDKAYRDDLHRQANAATQQYVGKTFFDEDTWQHSPKRIENLFGCEFAYHEGSTPWLVPVTDDPDEFARVLDRAEATDLASWAFPDALNPWPRIWRVGPFPTHFWRNGKAAPAPAKPCRSLAPAAAARRRSSPRCSSRRAPSSGCSTIPS